MTVMDGAAEAENVRAEAEKLAAEPAYVLDARAQSLAANHGRLLRDLVALRRKHALSQAEVAARMGISQPAVAKLERADANPRLSTLRRYALAVGARLSDIVIDDAELLRSGEWSTTAVLDPAGVEYYRIAGVEVPARAEG